MPFWPCLPPGPTLNADICTALVWSLPPDRVPAAFKPGPSAWDQQCRPRNSSNRSAPRLRQNGLNQTGLRGGFRAEEGEFCPRRLESSALLQLLQPTGGKPLLPAYVPPLQVAGREDLSPNAQQPSERTAACAGGMELFSTDASRPTAGMAHGVTLTYIRKESISSNTLTR